jgi:hypothetical protein
MSNPFDQFDNPTLDNVMPRLIKQESGGRAGIVGPETPYGRAIGRAQTLPSTAKAMAKSLGVPYREDMLTGTSPEAAQYQDMLGRAYLEEGYGKTGSVDGALKYYHGGPNEALWGPKTQAYAQAVGGGQGNPFDQFDASQAQAQPQPAQRQTPAAQVQAPTLPPRVTQKPIKQQVDQLLGLGKGAYKPIDNASLALESVIRGSAAEKPLAMMGRGLRNVLPEGVVSFIDNPAAYYAQRERQGVVPGKIGEFAGNVAGTLPVMALPGGVFAQGAASGALLTDKRTMGGVAQDALIGGVAGQVADKALKGIGSVASDLLSKSPKIMDFPALETAYKAAYQKVDQSGFRFSKTNAMALADDLQKIVTDRGGKALYPDAWNMAQRAKVLARQKGGLPLTQLDDLRGQMYEYLVNGGGKEAGLGTAMRGKIDSLISKEATQNANLREARDLYTRFSKARTVMKRLESADLQAGRAYTGKNVNNAIRQKLSPLVDPMSNARIKNATPDEAAALKRAVTGTPMQNLVRITGSLLDPRGLLGMGLQAGGFATSGGLSLAGAPLGMAATAAGNRMSQRNVQELVRLIAAGGSKQALAKTPTAAARATAKAITAARRPAAAAAAAAIAQSQGR